MGEFRWIILSYGSCRQGGGTGVDMSAPVGAGLLVGLGGQRWLGWWWFIYLIF